MQALLLPSRLPPPPLLRRGALSAAASLFSPRLHGATLPTGRLFAAPRRLTVAAVSSSGPLYPTPPPTEQTIERAKLEQVIKRLEKTARYFKNLGSLGFWSQAVCTFVSAGILSFSTVVTGKVSSPFTFYATAAGIVAAFISVFWSFGYIRLSERLRKTASAPAKAPPRADVIKSLKNGIVLNILGMGAAVLGMQATVGGLVAKALTTSAVPYYQATSPGQSPVLALDVFLVQILLLAADGFCSFSTRLVQPLLGPQQTSSCRISSGWPAPWSCSVPCRSLRRKLFQHEPTAAAFLQCCTPLFWFS